MDESRIDDIPQVSPQENVVLTAPYTEDEISKAEFQMELNMAPGPDGFPAKIFQTFWDTIKKDLLELFEELHAGQLDLFRINFGEIILLPKRLTMLFVFSNFDQSTSLMFVSKSLQKLLLLH
jgi:hypothetical protein